MRIFEKNLKVGGEDEDSIFEIKDQILRIIEVRDIEVRTRSKILRFLAALLWSDPEVHGALGAAYFSTYCGS